MARLFLQYLGLLQQGTFALWHKKVAKVGSQFCHVLNKPSKKFARLINFCQSGEISSNLVTLFVVIVGLLSFQVILVLGKYIGAMVPVHGSIWLRIS